MELKQAEVLAQEIVEQLAPYCEQIEVAGSVRRRKPAPRDIDIVLIPSSQGQLSLFAAIQQLGQASAKGTKIERITYKGTQVDLYFAAPETWYTLLLIRTGSEAHNIKLTSLAKKRGWHLYADGRGLFSAREGGERIAGDSEESFFQALGIPYLPPEKRD